jgi:hypothetical protein
MIHTDERITQTDFMVFKREMQTFGKKEIKTTHLVAVQDKFLNVLYVWKISKRMIL